MIPFPVDTCLFASSFAPPAYSLPFYSNDDKYRYRPFLPRDAYKILYSKLFLHIASAKIYALFYECYLFLFI